jgi:hypothetical protein
MLGIGYGGAITHPVCDAVGGIRRRLGGGGLQARPCDREALIRIGDDPNGTVASGDHSNRRPPPEPLNAIGDARIDCFEHF